MKKSPTQEVEEVVIPTPDDFHIHFRQQDLLQLVMRTMGPFRIGVAMGNLIVNDVPKPIVTGRDVSRYRSEILKTRNNSPSSQ